LIRPIGVSALAGFFLLSRYYIDIIYAFKRIAYVIKYWTTWTFDQRCSLRNTTCQYRCFQYNISMARPIKDPESRMTIPYMLMLTAEQKAIIKEAADLAGLDMSAWIRPILLKAARQQMLGAKFQERQLKIR